MILVSQLTSTRLEADPGLLAVNPQVTHVINPLPAITFSQAYSYLPSQKALLFLGWYQIILLSDRGTQL